MTSASVLRLPLAATLLLATATAAAAPIGPTPYLSAADSPFANLGARYFHLEDFEDGSFNAPGVTSPVVAGVPAFVISRTSGLTDSVDGDDGAIDGSGLNGHSFFGNGALGITFMFDAAVLGSLPTHAGVVWTDGLGVVEMTVFGPGMTVLGTIGGNLADTSVAGTTAEDRFLGWIDQGGILGFRIANPVGGIEVDHLQYAGGVPVPVPATVPTPGGAGLLAASVAGFASWRAARRKRM